MMINTNNIQAKNTYTKKIRRPRRRKMFRNSLHFHGGPLAGPRATYHLPRGPYGRLKATTFESKQVKGSMIGGVPRIYYGWMKPGSYTRRRFEKMRNPFVDLDSGTGIYYRDTRDPPEAVRADADNSGVKGMDSAVDLYNEHRVVPDIYSEGFQWKHKLNTEYNQWRSNTWLTPDLIPPEHRGRLLCNFQVNVGSFEMEVAKFSPKDQRQWIYCCLYVGSGKGIAGWGQAIAPTTNDAKKEALRNAFSNLIGVDLENDGPVYPTCINVGGSRVSLYPSRKIVASVRIADILCAFGISCAGCKINIHAKQRPRGTPRCYQGVFEVISQMKSATEIAHARGKVPHSLVSNIFPYMEELRRRKGMFAVQPAGKDGMFPANRAVDNRLPDHLKRGYYDEQYWRDFFAGSSEHLSEPKLGLRSDQLRALVPPPDAVAPREQFAAGSGAPTRGSSSTREQQQLGGAAAAGPSPASAAAALRSAGGVGGRRTLADVLQRMGKSTDAGAGHIPVSNPYDDRKLADHIRAHFHLN